MFMAIKLIRVWSPAPDGLESDLNQNHSPVLMSCLEELCNCCEHRKHSEQKAGPVRFLQAVLPTPILITLNLKCSQGLNGGEVWTLEWRLVGGGTP